MDERITRAQVDTAFLCFAREVGTRAQPDRTLELECQHNMPGLHYTLLWNGRTVFKAHGNRECWRKLWDAVEVLRQYKWAKGVE